MWNDENSWYRAGQRVFSAVSPCVSMWGKVALGLLWDLARWGIDDHVARRSGDWEDTCFMKSVVYLA